MGFILESLKALKRVVTGEVIEQTDTTANGGWTTMSLRLKRGRGSDDFYVVLAAISRVNYQYFAFTRDEFGRFAQAVQLIRGSLVHTGQPEI